MMRWTRRRVLRVALAGGGVALLPRAGAVAQDGGTGLLRAPKQALVMGNSRYQQAPLRNPVNDANGMAEALKIAGFGVTLALELPRSAMQDAIRAYTDSLARTKSVGLFYFAGHGAQLAWRNYLIPVDSDIADVNELREQGVDVNSLIDGIRKAGNPMNIIILDACRNNPFGSVRRLDQKGLSQLDAPPGTLLAYATAPGNVAADGEGANGLYTENLLREIKTPEAKIEDVFKRVRLHVRRRTNGQQIPWESTSLEEDFYFIPPRALSALAEEEAERERKQEMALREKRRAEEEAERNKKRELALKEAQRVTEEAERKRREEQALREARLAEEEAARKYQQELALREKQLARDAAERRRKQEPAPGGKPDAALENRRFEEELALWERIKGSKEPEPLEDYLVRYPSGRYSELALLRLDQVLARLGEKKIEIVSAPENPYSKGTVAANTAYKVGDRYVYRQTDLLTKLEMKRLRRVVTEITETEVRYNEGRLVTDLLGNQLRFGGGAVWSPNQTVPTEFAVGRRWKTRFRVMPGKGGDTVVELDLRIADRERITVPAGTFNAFRIEAQGWQTGSGAKGAINVSWDWKTWYAPGEVRQPVAFEWFNRNRLGKIMRAERNELAEFRQS